MDHIRHNGTKNFVDSDSSSINYKEILHRISGFQTHLRYLANVLAGYSSKSLSIRNKNDEVAKCFLKYTKIEGFNTSSKLAMSIVAELVGKVGDHQYEPHKTAAIHRLETKVLPNLSSYGRICKCLMGDVRNAMAAEERLLSRKKIAKGFEERMTEEPKYRDVITDAERELENAMAESSRLGMLSQEQIIKFEHKRLMDLKESLEAFFKIEINKHAKSIELLTEAYTYIHRIDEDADLETLKRQLKLGEIQPTKMKASEDRFKSQKGKKTKTIESKESEADEYWNSESDTVKDLQKLMNSKISRPATAPITQKTAKKKATEKKKLHQSRQQQRQSSAKSIHNDSSSLAKIKKSLSSISDRILRGSKHRDEKRSDGKKLKKSRRIIYSSADEESYYSSATNTSRNVKDRQEKGHFKNQDRSEKRSNKLHHNIRERNSSPSIIKVQTYDREYERKCPKKNLHHSHHSNKDNVKKEIIKQVNKSQKYINKPTDKRVSFNEIGIREQRTERTRYFPEDDFTPTKKTSKKQFL